MSIYCTYITLYSGNKLPPFYIGSTSVKKIKNGYRGSVSSIEYKKIWKEELLHNPSLFKTKIISTHDDRKSATEKELKLQLSVNAATSDMYINKAYAKKSFMYGLKQSVEHKEKRSQSFFKPGHKTNVGRKMPEEQRQRTRLNRTDKRHSEESIEKMRLANLGKKDSDETRKKKSESMRGNPKPQNSMPFICRLSDRKVLTKSHASRCIPEIKPYIMYELKPYEKIRIKRLIDDLEVRIGCILDNDQFPVCF